MTPGPALMTTDFTSRSSIGGGSGQLRARRRPAPDDRARTHLAFDVILPTDSRQGKVLTQLSIWWF